MTSAPEKILIIKTIKKDTSSTMVRMITRICVRVLTRLPVACVANHCFQIVYKLLVRTYHNNCQSIGMDLSVWVSAASCKTTCYIRTDPLVAF